MPDRCGATERAASRLDPAVTAEMMMSELTTASAAELASRAPIVSPASRSRAPACLGKQDIPRGDLLDARLAQARGDRLSGFAEADEAEARLVTAHGKSLRWTR